MLIGIGVVLRIAVASVLALSACWKLSHSRSFARAFEGFAPTRLRRFSREAVVPVAVLEMLLAATLLAGLMLPQVSLVGPLSSLSIVGVFSMLVARADHADECGCWAMPFVDDGRRARRLLLARTGLVLAMLALAATLPAGVTVAAVAATPAGMVLAALTVELPEIIAVATFRRAQTVEG
jgi:hypothetical protein